MNKRPFAYRHGGNDLAFPHGAAQLIGRGSRGFDIRIPARFLDERREAVPGYRVDGFDVCLDITRPFQMNSRSGGRSARVCGLVHVNTPCCGPFVLRSHFASGACTHNARARFTSHTPACVGWICQPDLVEVGWLA